VGERVRCRVDSPYMTKYDVHADSALSVQRSMGREKSQNKNWFCYSAILIYPTSGFVPHSLQAYPPNGIASMSHTRQRVVGELSRCVPGIVSSFWK
jgi:hypothetical protein